MNHIHTYVPLFPGLQSIVAFAPEDGTGTGGAGGEGTGTGTGAENTGGDAGADSSKGGEVGSQGQTADQTKDGDAASKKDGDGTALGQAGDKKGEGDTADPKDVVPEDGVYDFGELPEGVTVTDEAKEAWGTTFKEAGLTQKQAEALVKMQTAQIEAAQQAMHAEIEERQTTDLAAAKADKDIGGDNWETSIANAGKAFEATGGEALKNLILSTGHGNNVEIIRELARIGASFKGDNFDGGSDAAKEVPREQSWYGETTPMTKVKGS